MWSLIEDLKDTILNRYIVIPMIMLLVTPSILSIIFGYEFINLPYQQIPTIIVNHDSSETALGLVDMLRENDTLDVIGYSNQDNDIKESFATNQAMAAILIPENFSRNLLNGKEAKIMLFNDGAISPAASTVRGTLSEVMGTIKNGYLIKVAEGKLGLSPQEAMNTIVPMGYTSRLIGNPTKNIGYMMLQGVLLTSVQVGVVAVGSSIRERASYLMLLIKGLLCGIVGTISALSCVYIQIKFFGFPYRGSVLAGILLTFFCCLGYSFFGIFSNLSAKGDIEGAVSKCSTISLTMLLSGYTFPVVSMPVICQKISNWIPNIHYIVPLRDISLIGSTFSEVSHHIIWMINFSIVMLLIATFKFMSAKAVYRKIRKKKLEESWWQGESNTNTEI